jgi:integrase
MRVNTSKILLLDEIQAVLVDLQDRSEDSINAWTNLIIFRLSCCCGLRASEICGLTMDDLILEGARPIIQIRKENTKQHRGKYHSREVPLWWDAGTLEDLRAWADHRREQGTLASDPFVCSQSRGQIYRTAGKQLDRHLAARRWKTALGVLGSVRQKQISIHGGRHSFCSHAMAAGRSVIEVQRAAGHSDAGMTLNTYGHLVETDKVRDIFA